MEVSRRYIDGNHVAVILVIIFVDVLQTIERDGWARARALLSNDPVNVETLATIDRYMCDWRMCVK
jgi:hypothetical protein